MKALLSVRIGGTEAFELSEIRSPEAGPGELLVRMLARHIARLENAVGPDGADVIYDAVGGD
ncbi:MAG TPA: hypothetical protein VNT42_07705 [Sphingomonas sp.]|nr:hypothetical protein [Sphingomonas sp.]